MPFDANVSMQETELTYARVIHIKSLLLELIHCRSQHFLLHWLTKIIAVMDEDNCTDSWRWLHWFSCNWSTVIIFLDSSDALESILEFSGAHTQVKVPKINPRYCFLFLYPLLIYIKWGGRCREYRLHVLLNLRKAYVCERRPDVKPVVFKRTKNSYCMVF